MRLSIAVCVDGHISGINHWVGKESNMGEMSEISRKFLAITKKYPDQKSVKISEKIFGKKECKKKGLYEATVSTAPFFKTAEGFIAHLKRQNESIEVLDYEDYRSRLAQKMETPDAAQ
ncbi:MAG: hypothetical protein Q8K07_10485 [Methylicorpusculum sp.]|nr:hypothetical protein [Methylicorpusculum sp.]MDP2202435.1 hypothetical protein [Methylicorpusculum sp.]